MRELEERIRRDGIIEDGDVLKVDSFLLTQGIRQRQQHNPSS